MSSDPDSKPSLPSLQQWFTDTYLYDSIDLEAAEDAGAYVHSIELPDNAIDLFCVACARPSTFSIAVDSRWRTEGISRWYRHELELKRNIRDVERTARDEGMSGDHLDTHRETLIRQHEQAHIDARRYLLDDRFLYVETVCSRDHDHRATLVLRLAQHRLMKVGQYPSVADMCLPDIELYRPVLPGDKFAELHRAIGLSSHGVHIGAFSYLRRIFEFLVHNAWQQAIENGDIDPSVEYHRLRMDERISTVGQRLPAFMRDNPKLYGILSKGIHELSEKACANAFQSIYGSIRLILQQRLSALEMERETQRIKKALDLEINDASKQPDMHVAENPHLVTD